MELALTAPIDTATAAAGDPVSAEVVKPVRRSASGDILIHPGAIVRGRITRLERHLLPEPYFLIAMSFNRLTRGDISSPFAAKYDSNAALAQKLGAALHSTKPRPGVLGRGHVPVSVQQTHLRAAGRLGIQVGHAGHAVAMKNPATLPVT